ncbi:MAG TPA: RNA polymerase sigma factor [Polyangia bacterium]
MITKSEPDTRPSIPTNQQEPDPRSAFNREIARSLPSLYSRAMYLVRDPAGAADLVQDTVVNGLRGLDGFAPGTNLRAWLNRIMLNLHIECCRRVRREASFIRRSAAEPVAAMFPQEVQQEDSERTLPVPPSLSEIEQAVSKLPDFLREIVEMRHNKKRPYKRISQELGIPVKTVGSRLHRGRRELRRILVAEAATGNIPTISQGSVMNVSAAL